jgi:acyl-CoA synthetase (AMP-forming)/AMP-acid ligase II
MVVYSGDQVRIDEEGLLYFIGRWDEMIKCAGNRISPTEVEEVIYQCSGVADAVALGVPHETYGQSVLAVVSLTGQAALTETDILEYCRDGMPSYMVPSEVEIWDSLPRNSNGKLDRAAIRKAVLDRKELQVANE